MDPIVYKTVIGLDIGQHAVKAVRAVVRGGVFKTTHLETMRLPAGMGATETAAMLARWLEQLGFKGEPCVIGLRGLTVLFQTLALPPQDPRPADQAVAMEIARLSEISTESMLYGFAPIATEDETRRFLDRNAPWCDFTELMTYVYMSGSAHCLDPRRYGIRRKGNVYDEIGGLAWPQHVETMQKRLEILMGDFWSRLGPEGGKRA